MGIEPPGTSTNPTRANWLLVILAVGLARYFGRHCGGLNMLLCTDRIAGVDAFSREEKWWTLITDCNTKIRLCLKEEL